VPVEELARRLTDAGLEVEAVNAEGDDIIIETEVTWNRPDLLCHIGTAREVATVCGSTLVLPDVKVPESPSPVEELTSVEVAEAELCPRYTARVVTGVKIAPSPRWLVDKLSAIGVRPVNNVVDITNFILFECGQPLHAFDMKRLAERRIVVRRGLPGETITSIDGSLLELDPSVLVICDASKPVAVAGIMGGLESEISDDTTDVLLESALFDPASIRDTSRKLGLESDSSYRFERGVDPEGIVRASDRAAQLIAEVAGGAVACGIIDVNSLSYEPLELALRVSEFKRIMGFAVAADRAAEILRLLGFSVKAHDGETVNVTVPSWRRQDVTREIDLIEEVARIEGLDKVSASARIPLARVRENALYEAGGRAKSILVAAGYYETITFSFTDSPTNDAFNPWDVLGELTTTSAFYKELSALRKSLVPALLAVKKRNHDNGTRSVKLFEQAAVYLPREGEKLPEEKQILALYCDADETGNSPSAFAALKGVIEVLLAELGISGARFQPWDDAPAFLRGRAAAGIELDGSMCGYAGLLSDSAIRGADLPTASSAARPAVAEFDLGILTANADYTRRYLPLARFPAVERDLNVVLDSDVNWGAVRQSVAASGAEHLETVNFVNEFRDEKRFGPGRKSVTARMVFRNPERTLLSEEADDGVRKALDALKHAFGATLRA